MKHEERPNKRFKSASSRKDSPNKTKTHLWRTAGIYLYIRRKQKLLRVGGQWRRHARGGIRICRPAVTLIRAADAWRVVQRTDFISR